MIQFLQIFLRLNPGGPRCGPAVASCPWSKSVCPRGSDGEISGMEISRRILGLDRTTIYILYHFIWSGYLGYDAPWLSNILSNTILHDYKRITIPVIHTFLCTTMLQYYAIIHSGIDQLSTTLIMKWNLIAVHSYG